MSIENNFTIDIENIIRQKAGRKSRYVPGFVIRMLKRIIHQDEVNSFLTRSSGKVGVEWLEECVRYLDMNLIIEGEENLPSADDGKLYTFVSNHPLGGVDGVALGATLGRKYNGQIKYLVNDLLMNLHGLAPLCIPINKVGSQSKQFPMMVEAGFNSSNHIIMFPAGLCSRRRNGVVKDLQWKKTFITKSIESHRDVIPIHFGGSNSQFFYRMESFCKAIGLRFNLSMLFLVDEMYKNVHKTFTIKIGKPISWQTFDKSRTASGWAQYVQDIVYNL